MEFPRLGRMLGRGVVFDMGKRQKRRRVRMVTDVYVDSDHGRLRVTLTGSEVCAVCGRAIKAAQFCGGKGPIIAGDPDVPLFACTSHFMEPGTAAYERHVRKFSKALARSMEQSRWPPT